MLVSSDKRVCNIDKLRQHPNSLFYQVAIVKICYGRVSNSGYGNNEQDVTMGKRASNSLSGDAVHRLNVDGQLFSTQKNNCFSYSRAYYRK